MKSIPLSVTTSEHFLGLSNFYFADTLIPSMDKRSMIQTHYKLRHECPFALSVSIDMKDTLKYWKNSFGMAKTDLVMPGNKFPYGLTEASWWQYCLAPHSYLDLGSGRCQAGLNFSNRFLHLDWKAMTACVMEPEIGDELLSTTNWYDQEMDELWFASWPGRDTLRRIYDSGAHTRATVWKLSLHDEKLTRIWQGPFGDSLHQLAISPDRRYLVLTELGLRTAEPVPEQPPDEAPDMWFRMREAGLLPSEVIVLDLATLQEWRLSLSTAGHVEFDPEYPDICYLSCHNIGLLGLKVGIFGPGCIKKFRLTENGPVWLGEFTDSRFHRTTTHAVFHHRGKTLICVSGYPASLFLIDAASMTLYKVMEKTMEEKVDTIDGPHLCHQDSYGIVPSPDGEAILLSGTGFVTFAEIATGRFAQTKDIGNYMSNFCFTGHLGTMTSPVRREG